MAKKPTQTRPAQKHNPGANPYQNNNSVGNNLGKMIGAVCLLVFIIFEQLWIGTLACALAFAVLYVMQVFVERSKTPFTSMYLYATAATALLAYLEYRYQIISNLLGL